MSNKKKTTENVVAEPKTKGGIWSRPLSVQELEKIFASPLPPAMPEDCLPRPVKAALWNTPSICRPSYSQCVFPAFATRTHDIAFMYTNGILYPPKLNAVQIAPSGVGKNPITNLLNHILYDIVEESHANMEKMVEHNEQNASLPDNKKKQLRPKNLPQQIVFYDTTFPALCLQVKEARGYPLFLEVKEIEDLYNLQSGRGGKSPLVILREADDPDGRLRQRRVGEKSVTVDEPLWLNYVISTNPSSVQSFYARDLIRGGLSRAEMTTIVKPDIGAKEESFGRYDEKYMKRLLPFLNNLSSVHGNIVCKQAQQLADQLKEECADFAISSGDNSWDDLTHRGLTHSFLKSCLLYVANGCKWEHNIEPFIRWSLFYCLWVKTYYFIDAIREAESKVVTSKTGPRNKLTLIPSNVFTFEDVQKMRKSQNMNDSHNATENQVGVWLHRKLIKRLEDGRYEKIEFRIEQRPDFIKEALAPL